MPELPEVETIRKSLSRAIVGKKIVGVEILSEKQFPDDPKEVIGSRVLSVDRRAKNLIVKLSNQKALFIHLKLSGQLIWAPKAGITAIFKTTIPFAGNSLPAKTTRVIISLDGGKLFFNELRKFGWIRITGQNQLNQELEKFGPEPFGKDFSVEYLKRVFQKTSKPIKLVLIDQEKIAGIGNIYANDGLFEAGISPLRPAKELSNLEIKKLRKAIIKVLEEGLKYGGSSAADEAYIRPDATPGSYQEHFRVYQRAGEKCFRCGGIIKRIKISGRGTFYCPRCQK